jgi:hypothetical protein
LSRIFERLTRIFERFGRIVGPLGRCIDLFGWIKARRDPITAALDRNIACFDGSVACVDRKITCFDPNIDAFDPIIEPFDRIIEAFDRRIDRRGDCGLPRDASALETLERPAVFDQAPLDDAVPLEGRGRVLERFRRDAGRIPRRIDPQLVRRRVTVQSELANHSFVQPSERPSHDTMLAVAAAGVGEGEAHGHRQSRAWQVEYHNG